MELKITWKSWQLNISWSNACFPVFFYQLQ